MSTDRPDPYTVLGLTHGASAVEIAAAYRRAVRACHPDTPHPDPDRLAAVIAAYRRLRDRGVQQQADGDEWSPHRRDIPVRVHPRPAAPPKPDLRVGTVRRHS